jgi:hypothetical protein
MNPVFGIRIVYLPVAFQKPIHVVVILGVRDVSWCRVVAHGDVPVGVSGAKRWEGKDVSENGYGTPRARILEVVHFESPRWSDDESHITGEKAEIVDSLRSRHRALGK